MLKPQTEIQQLLNILVGQNTNRQCFINVKQSALIIYYIRNEMKKLFILLMGVSGFWACGTKTEEQKKQIPNLVFNDLIGTWKMEGEEQYEKWTKNSDGTYSSTVFTVNENDTVITEKVKIYQRDGKWDFETIVKEQNNGKPIDFLSEILNDSTVQFENANHDFPKLINYTLKGDRNLSAFIAGKTDTIHFNYTRVEGKLQ